METARPVLFLFKSGRLDRLAEKGPREFFYGFSELERLGPRAELVEEENLPQPGLNGWPERLATRFLDPLAGLNAGTLARLSTRPALTRLNQASAIVATTNAQGLALGALKFLGLLAPPVLFLPMGVWPFRAGFLRRAWLARWLGQLALAPISRSEAAWLKRQLGIQADIGYLPFGVDTHFWTPSPTEVEGDYVFSIGNDRHRDWTGLAAAWSADLPPLKLVTRRPVPPSSGRLEVLAGDWTQRPISDQGIRQFYREALFVVLPIQETIQPSGQSACLQAMACGKAVILSKIAGLWDDELLKDGETCLLVPPGDEAALAAAAKKLAENPQLCDRLGSAARQLVTQRFTIERMGEALLARLHVLMAQS
ncbi:MAG: glycosyltransferase family 4 protein [Rhodospirillales bacterium]